jgi:hypothetical protein
MISTGLAWSGQLDDYLTIDQYFASNQLTAKKFFDADKMVDDMNEELPLTGDIYEFDAKSTKRAFFYSLVLPGAGQYYAGSRIKPLYYLAAEALIWTGYFVYHGKGDDKKAEYQEFALDTLNYRWQDFMYWWLNLSPEAQDSFSHRLPWDDENNSPIFNHEFFENIGKYDQFQLGWTDIDEYPPPYGEAELSPLRQTYLDMRKDANDYYQNANTMIMLALGNRLISAFEAALTAKKYNKGQKRFAFKMKTKKFGEANVPILTWNYRF